MHRIGTVSLLIASALIVGYFGYKFATLEELPDILQVASGVGTVGLLAFIAASMKDTWGKRDKYEDAQ